MRGGGPAHVDRQRVGTDGDHRPVADQHPYGCGGEPGRVGTAGARLPAGVQCHQRAPRNPAVPLLEGDHVGDAQRRSRTPPIDADDRKGRNEIRRGDAVDGDARTDLVRGRVHMGARMFGKGHPVGGETGVAGPDA